MKETPTNTISTEQPSEQIPSDQKSKSVYKNPIFLFVVILLLLGLLFSLWKIFQGSPISNLASNKQKTGLSKDSVVIQLPQDEDIQRYPLSEITIASLNVYLNTYEGLTVYRGGNNLMPGLAESWTNPDPRTWRIKLRKGVTFHSGDVFTAKDVKFTIEQAKMSETADVPWLSQSMAARVDAVQIVDDYTVNLITKEPDATLISWMVYIGMVSEAQVKRDGIEKAVGTGPYKLLSISNREATLEANNAYWGGIPTVKKLTYKVVTDPDKAVSDLQNGLLDIIWLSTKDTTNVSQNGYQSFEYRTGGIDNYIAFDLNSAKTTYVSEKTNPFKDKRTRKAIQLALDVPQLIANVGINAEPLSQFATRELVGYNGEIAFPVRNITQAKNLLTEAGYPNGFDVTVITDQQTYNVKVANEIKKQLADINVRVTIESPETEELYEKIADGDFSMLHSFYYPDTLDSIDLLDTLFHSVSGSHGLWNVSNFSNKDLDTLITQATSSFDTNRRIELTRKAHALIVEELPSIPLYTKKFQIVAREDLSFKPSINMILNGFDISARNATQ